MLVGLVPGSPKNIANGRAVLHGLGAVAAIAGGNAAAIASARGVRGMVPTAVRRLGPVLGVTGIASGLALSTHRVLPDGVWERLAVYTFMLWQGILGATLLRRP